MKESYRQKPFLTLAAGVAAMALLLAGCGGGSSSTTPTTPEPVPPPPPPGPTAESLKADAADAVTAAEMAGMAATQAEKDALKYAGMLTADKVDGESATATANAQMILNAEMAANTAVMDADSALQDAMDTKVAAEALSEDDAERADAIAAADRAIKEATAQKAAAQAILDKNPLQTGTTTPTTEVDSLKDAVALVKGDNPLADDYPMMPAARGKAVATTVKTALATITDPTTITLAGAPMHATKMNDSSDIEAMTWAMIVGEDKVMSKRLGTIGSGGYTISVGNGVLPVASIAGMAASKVNPAGDDLSSAGGSGSLGSSTGVYTDATSTDATDINYNGIPGVVVCLGGTDGCSVNAAGNLVGSWYFTPNTAEELYVANPDMAGMYMVATMYARYGYWLTFTSGSEAINAVAEKGHSTTNTASLNLIRPDTATADVTARYNGKAAGISALGDASGHFTANVNLTATFGQATDLTTTDTNTDSKISGSISGFTGNAVNSNWRVTLNDILLNTDATNPTPGVAWGGATAGTWTTQGYGPGPVDTTGDGTLNQNQRPEGFFGTFNANFTDGGMAVGAYTTRAAE